MPPPFVLQVEINQHKLTATSYPFIVYSASLDEWMSKPFENGAFEKGWMSAHPTFYCRKIFYDELGRYNDSFKIAGDFELMLRFIQVNKIKTKFINKNLIKMEDGGISNSGLLSKIIILKEEFKSFNLNSIRINKIIFIFNKMKKIKEFSRFNYL